MTEMKGPGKKFRALSNTNQGERGDSGHRFASFNRKQRPVKIKYAPSSIRPNHRFSNLDKFFSVDSY